MGFFDRLRLDSIFRKKSLTPVSGGGNWYSVGSTVNESFTGAWQRNQELKRTDLLGYHAVFSCLTLISSDVGKLRFYPKKMVKGVLQVTQSKATRLLKKPNNLQTWQQFAEQWINSNHFRFGASGLLNDLLGTLQGKAQSNVTSSY